MDKVRVAVVGLNFGSAFVPIYQAWDKTELVAVCRRDAQKLNAFADEHGIEKRYTDYMELLKDPDIDAVHINSDLESHGWMAIAALKAGKHVASTVTMSLKKEECEEIVRLEEETGKVYMMMETAIYTREFLYFKKLYENGEIGKLQFLRGSHQQNMSMPGWPSYWYGMPPMWYGSHAVSPLSEILGSPISEVRCMGSGRISAQYAGDYGSPFAAESMHVKFKGSDVVGEVTRTLFDTVRQYRESFDFYGSKKTFEWQQCADENPVVFSGFEDAERVRVPDTDVYLPEQIAPFAKRRVISEDLVSFIQGDDHGGSHPHLVHEFISAILEGRKSHVNARVAANWTVVGMLAHESAMNDGKVLEMPSWALY